jgi:hypothetical protein
MSTDESSRPNSQAWTPTDNEHTRECQNCGARVGPEFVRFYSGNDGKVHACTECANYSQLKYKASGRTNPRYQSGMGHDISEGQL